MTMELALRRPTWHRSERAEGRRVRPRLRRSLARAYESVLRDAIEPDFWITARIPMRRDEVVSARADFELLIARLRDVERPVDPAGFRLAQKLLCEGDGPLYTWAEPCTLRRRVRVILEAME
jgi:hypothetical protein